VIHSVADDKECIVCRDAVTQCGFLVSAAACIQLEGRAESAVAGGMCVLCVQPLDYVYN
jgi:hypothetical protein